MGKTHSAKGRRMREIGTLIYLLPLMYGLVIIHELGHFIPGYLLGQPGIAV